ncbi:MAG TPA: hypothetical protein DCS93_22225 [Microscillaceae bacterium]|nr:hypothetical protein [Microscillaceae bacterium]
MQTLPHNTARFFHLWLYKLHFRFKMKGYLTFFLLLVFVQLSPAQNHQKIKHFFGKSYPGVVQYLEQHKPTLKKHLPTHPPEAAFILAMGFPELLRYNTLQNRLETAFLEALYVKKGPTYANFSVGRFQMKPSFAESLEQYCQKYLKFTGVKIYRYEVVGINNIRKARVKRLNNLGWQLKYLHSLYLALNHRFAHKKFTSRAQKLRFFAAAYNFGFLNTATKIQQWSQNKAFPYGKNYIGKQQNYTDIALDFYLNEALKFFK